MASSIELTRIRPEFARFLTEEPPGSRSPIDVGDIFPQSLSNDETTLAAIHPPWKRNLFALLEQPKSSKSAFLVHMVTTGLILTSAVVTVLETVPTLHTISTGAWFGMETSLVALFTVEYIARCLAWSGTWMSLLRWQTSFFGIIDLLSVAPYYIEILLHQDTSVLFRFSILRMFRLLRVFKPFRYNNTILLTIEVMYVSVRRSQHALLAIGFFVFMILTVFSTLLYFAERGTWDPVLDTFVNADGDPTQFSSIPAAAWFVLVTITTVGYGEITPRSFLGRLITLPILMFGLLLITLPSFVLGREFSIVWEKMTAKRHEDQHETDSPVEYTFPNLGLPSPGLPSRQRDLSNHKLAQNQTELSRQISDLRATVEMQGRILERMLDVLEGSSSKGKGVDRT
ncbi:Potassium voltage-gated channel subfamily B member 2 [Hypsizygus marmoreus]|uniref:Potassium voltage-gated channel subfamily B member 2 n=1 Tax=Hypsizygus marmoreus TaxID=39966 RepID=A0A369JK30_HYPMA|nr:Potassium voltage-gated channel subfamily B member 2 [Hypsizygus marmoreus]